MYLYHVCQAGPPSLLLPKGCKINRLPKIFQEYSRLLVTSWGHDPSEIPQSGALPLLLEALQHSAVLIQAHASNDASETKHIAFPLSTDSQGIYLISTYLFYLSAERARHPAKLVKTVKDIPFHIHLRENRLGQQLWAFFAQFHTLNKNTNFPNIRILARGNKLGLRMWALFAHFCTPKNTPIFRNICTWN